MAQTDSWIANQRTTFTLAKSNRGLTSRFPQMHLWHFWGTLIRQKITRRSKITCIVSRFLFFACTWCAFWAFNLPANFFLRETIESLCQKDWKAPKDSSPNLKLYNQRTNLCSSVCGSRREKGDSSGTCWIFSNFSLAIRFLWAINGIDEN